MPPVVLTIAGSDSSGASGVQLDLKALQACGVYGVCAVTAVTAQNTREVHRVFHVPPRVAAAQIDAVCADFRVAAVKVGMLGRAQMVRAVADRIRRRNLNNVVVDPVLSAKDGTPLLCGRGVAGLKELLLPLATVVTPNVPEAEALSGLSIADEASLLPAAQRILKLGVGAVLIKGGHLPGEPVDTLFIADEVHRFSSARIGAGPAKVRGTGCLYSSAVAAQLALGKEVTEACEFAQAFVRQAISGAVRVGRANRVAWLGEPFEPAPPLDSLEVSNV
jgi:hydroxymethylpyrimidine/phosphomethylpyrimidine kinase